MRIKHQLGGGYLLATSGAAFVLLVGLILFAPSISQPEASATENNSSTSTSATENNSAISTYAATPTVGISLPTSIDFADVLPTPSGATTTATADLTITTSDSAGYSLYLYSSDGDNSLKPKISSLANISQITATAGGVGLTLSSLKPNTWGYNLGTTTPDDTTTYSAVPTDDSTPIQTKDTSDTNSANDTYTLSFGAKVDSTIASGAYSNALTVAVVAEPKAITYIQDLTLADCQSRASDADFTVTDRRDDNDYTVRYINGACWMTQNLRLAGGRTLTSEDSNVVGSWEFPNSSFTLGNSYTEARSAISADPEYALEYGGYYNYCAASAGTVCSSSSAQDATQDICPKGWRLPTRTEQSGIRSYGSAFSPVLSGNYYNGALSNTGSYGYWWSATASNSDYQYSLRYNGISLNTSNLSKGLGYSVRCVRSTPGTLTINFNGNGSTGGSTASQQIAAGNTAALNANGFTRTGYVFTGWNTAADGSGTSYADGADYTVTPATGDTTVTLYAQWRLPINHLGDVTYMQDFTSTLCATSEIGATTRLTDSRDGKQYWVAKLADGNCWMTQNLDLDLSTKEALTPEDSDVSRSWTPGNDTLTDGTQTTTGNTAVWSWNLGDYVLTTPNAGTSCGSSGISNFGDCTSVGFQSVAGMTPMTDGDATDVISGNTYNAHYHVGNHYTWNAATAGGTITGQDATDSICPKGWQLPTSNNSNSGSFQALTDAYNISGNAAGGTASVSAPLYFVRSGLVYSGSLRNAGGGGGYWSSTANSNTGNAYYLAFGSGYVDPSNYGGRYPGSSIRCLASQ